MLTVYTNKQQIANDGKKLIRVNDLFFNTETNLSNTEITKKILKTIDKAEYNSEFTFIGRTKALGALNKNMLSTGTKTLLNILEHPDLCFDVCECSNNALCMLPLIREGNIYWRYPAAAYSADIECDILYNGEHFSSFDAFLESVYNEEEFSAQCSDTMNKMNHFDC